MASFLAAGMQTTTWLSAGMGEAGFSSRLARTRATKHEAAHAESEAVAGTAVLVRPLLHARALCDHGAPRRSPQKPHVWSTEATYLPGSTAVVPEERSAALIYAGSSV
jgi:hypothetical protein